LTGLRDPAQYFLSFSYFWSIYGGSQLVLADKSAGQAAPAIWGHFAALRVGQLPYQLAVLGVNAALLLLILAEALRTRWWRGLPGFDTLDFASVVDAALFKGVAAVAGAWVLQRGGRREGREVFIKMEGSETGDGEGCKTGAVNGHYVEVTDCDGAASVTKLTKHLRKVYYPTPTP
jgi:hypothetical protein